MQLCLVFFVLSCLFICSQEGVVLWFLGRSCSLVSTKELFLGFYEGVFFFYEEVLWFLGRRWFFWFLGRRCFWFLGRGSLASRKQLFLGFYEEVIPWFLGRSCISRSELFLVFLGRSCQTCGLATLRRQTTQVSKQTSYDSCRLCTRTPDKVRVSLTYSQLHKSNGRFPK